MLKVYFHLEFPLPDVVGELLEEEVAEGEFVVPKIITCQLNGCSMLKNTFQKSTSRS